MYLRTFGNLQVYYQFALNLNNYRGEVKCGRKFLRIVQVGNQRIEYLLDFFFVDAFNGTVVGNAQQ